MGMGMGLKTKDKKYTAFFLRRRQARRRRYLQFAPKRKNLAHRKHALRWLGSFAFSSDIGAGWAGEAFGKQMAAMVIEGNWITGAMTNDFPDVAYTVAELPAGPAGKGTLQFTNCWGIAG